MKNPEYALLQALKMVAMLDQASGDAGEKKALLGDLVFVVCEATLAIDGVPHPTFVEQMTVEIMHDLRAMKVMFDYDLQYIRKGVVLARGFLNGTIPPGGHPTDLPNPQSSDGGATTNGSSP